MVTPILLERFLLAILLIGVGTVLYWIFTRLVLVRARKSGTRPGDLPGLRAGLPAILYFTTPDCVACKTVQRPALQRVKETLGDQLQIIEVNAQEQTALADRWGVLSVPTTFVLDSKGEPTQVNYGTANAETLVRHVHKVLYVDPAKGLPGEECC